MPVKSLPYLTCFILGGWLVISLFGPNQLYAISGRIQPKLVSSSFLPVGSGARAMGVGGAFLAIADDATAASWNPAGLIRLTRPQLSLVGSYFLRRDESTCGAYPETSVSDQVDSTHLNYLSVAYPRLWYRWNVIFSLNYQYLYDMNLFYHRTWKYQAEDEAGDGDLTMDWDLVKKGALSTLSPAIAVQITKKVALGLTVNFWPSTICSRDNGWTEELYLNFKEPDEDDRSADILQTKDRYTFSGMNYHFGFRWKINPQLTLGSVVKTPFSAKIGHESITYTRLANGIYTYETQKTRETLVMPPSYGLGLAFRFSDSLTLAFDVYRTEWDKHKLHTATGTISPVTGEPFEASSIKPTTHVRFGAEYLFIQRRTIVAARFGVFYDPEPSKNHPEDFYGASLGFGFSLKQIDIDLAYQFRLAKDLPTISFQGETDHDDISQHLLYLSLIYRL